MNHNHFHSETFTKISSDIHISAMQLTVSTVYLNKAEKAAAKTTVKLLSKLRKNKNL